MDNEKMMILKMLEDGRIDAAEAARLIGAVDGGDAPSKKSSAKQPSAKEPQKKEKPTARAQSRQQSYQAADRTTDKSYERSSDHSYSNNNRPPSKSDFTSDLSKKFETFAKDMEPKIQKFSATVADATGKMTDKISKSLGSAPSPSASYPTAPSKAGYANLTEQVFEAVVTSGFNEFNFSGLNGDVLIQGYNGDKISARIHYRAKKGRAPIEIMQLGSKYFLSYEEDDFDKVCIDAFVPSSMFDSVAVSTINGEISVSAIEPTSLSVSNLNGGATLSGISCENIKADCNGGAIKLENLKALDGKIEAFNGNVNAAAVDIQNLDISALNGHIGMNIHSFASYDDYMWAVETSNAKMTLNLPSSRDVGYHIKAHATFSSIKIGLTGLNYIVSDPSYAEAKSIHYDTATKNIKLILETSNAPLVIN